MNPILQHASYGVGLSSSLCVFVYNPEMGIMGIRGTLDKIASPKLDTLQLYGQADMHLFIPTTHP
jgi:hypothetical protein